MQNKFFMSLFLMIASSYTMQDPVTFRNTFKEVCATVASSCPSCLEIGDCLVPITYMSAGLFFSWHANHNLSYGNCQNSAFVLKQKFIKDVGACLYLAGACCCNELINRYMDYSDDHEE